MYLMTATGSGGGEKGERNITEKTGQETRENEKLSRQ